MRVHVEMVMGANAGVNIQLKVTGMDIRSLGVIPVNIIVRDIRLRMGVDIQMEMESTRLSHMNGKNLFLIILFFFFQCFCIHSMVLLFFCLFV
jgi:hypothetical protein